MHDIAPEAERKSILLIDDDKILGRLMTIILEKEGYEVAVCGDGSEAVRALETRSFDLLIVDLMMPVMDGLRFLRWLRDDARSDVPALVLTSVDDEGICQDVLDAGPVIGNRQPLVFEDFGNAGEQRDHLVSRKFVLGCWQIT